MRTKQTARMRMGMGFERAYLPEPEVDFNANDSSEWQESDVRKTLSKMLEKNFTKSSTGTFAGSCCLADAPNPGLTIEGHGMIGLPLGSLDAAKIVELSEQAPFGKGDQLATDINVRDTRQIDAPKVSFANKFWHSYMANTILPKACDILGVNVRSVQANLYKLLLYEAGGHFKRHRDTEKESRMFATLIVILPSEYTGGQMKVTHAGRQQTFDLAADSTFAPSFIVLYTDVEHEILPVTSGKRLVLTYNLVHISNAAIPRAPVLTGELLNFKNALEDWVKSESNRIEMFVHPLDHRYSMQGLSSDLMKTSDKAKTMLFANYAEEMGVSVYLAHVNITCTNIENDGETEVQVEHVVHLDGEHAAALESLKIDTDSMSPAFDTWSPDSEDEESYQGNYPGDVTQRYHPTCLLFWRETHDTAIRMECNGGKEFRDDVEALTLCLEGNPDDADLKQEIVDLVRAARLTSLVKKDRKTLVKCATALHDTALLEEIIASAPINDKLGRWDEAFWMQIFATFGLDAVNSIVASCLGTILLIFNVDASRLGFVQAVTKAISSRSKDDKSALWDNRLSMLSLAPVGAQLPSLERVLQMASVVGFQEFRGIYLDSFTIFTQSRDRSDTAQVLASFHFSILLAFNQSPHFSGSEQVKEWTRRALETHCKSFGAARFQIYGPQVMPNDQVLKFKTIVDLGLAAHAFDAIKVLLQEVSPVTPITVANAPQLAHTFQPLAGVLRAWLTQEPFLGWVKLWQAAIPQVMSGRLYKLSPIGYSELDKFLQSDKQAYQMACYAKDRTRVERGLQTHVENGRLTVRFNSGRPPTLTVCKTGTDKESQVFQALAKAFYATLAAVNPAALEMVQPRPPVPLQPVAGPSASAEEDSYKRKLSKEIASKTATPAKKAKTEAVVDLCSED